jgi:hypothetical protein
LDQRFEFHRLYEALRSDERRNALICADVRDAASEGRSPLLLTERTEHLQLLAERLSSEIPHVIVLRGGMGRKKLQSALDQLKTPSAQPLQNFASGEAEFCKAKGCVEGAGDFGNGSVHWRGI